MPVGHLILFIGGIGSYSSYFRSMARAFTAAICFRDNCPRC